MITVTQARENDRTTFCRQFTFNKNGYSNRETAGAVVSGMPMSGILASSLPDTTTINIPENETKIPFYKVKNRYEGSDNTLVMRVELDEQMAFASSGLRRYSASDVDAYVNGAYSDRIPNSVKSQIVESDIKVNDNESTISIITIKRKFFLASATEYGLTFSIDFPVEGEKFPNSEMYRVGRFGGVPTYQITRTVRPGGIGGIWYVTDQGTPITLNANTVRGRVRPCFCLSPNALVSPNPNPDGSYDLIY